MTELTGLCCFTVSWSQLVRCFRVTTGQMRCFSPVCVPSAAIARWGALWSRRVWRAGWATGPGMGAYQRAGCGRWVPHRAPCPLTPLGCHLEPLQLPPAGIWGKTSRMMGGECCSRGRHQWRQRSSSTGFFSATDLLHFTVRIANLGVLLYIDDIKICKLCC